ncbi:MAG: hypothetical protein ABJA37_02730, partial [Ferruginibacter sp.]
MKKLLIILVLGLPMLFQFCSSTKKAQAVKASNITYMANVQDLVMGNCSPCHIPPKGFKKPFDNYNAVMQNIDEIIERIKKQPDEKGFMPFKHSRLPDSTILVFENWKKAGTPEK